MFHAWQLIFFAVSWAVDEPFASCAVVSFLGYLILLIGFFRSSNDNALRWMPQGLTDDKATLVQVISWCRQATSHYLSQCWLSSLLPYKLTNGASIVKLLSFVSLGKLLNKQPSYCDLRRHGTYMTPAYWYSDHYNYMSVMVSQITDDLTVLFNSIFRPRSKKTPKLELLALCDGNPSVTGGFPHKGSLTR